MKVLTLFDIGGKLLVSFTQEKPFKIGNTVFEAQIQPDGILQLSIPAESDNRDATYKKIVGNMEHELNRRKQDISFIEKDIAKIMTKMENGDEDIEKLGLEMARLVGLKGQHKKRIFEVQKKSNISVTYQKIRKVRSAFLSQGVFTKLPWFSKPVMWCTEIVEKIKKNISAVTEEMPLRKRCHMYIVGGNCGATSSISSVERYQPSQNLWQVITKMTSKRDGCGVAVINGQLYVMGGFVNSLYLSTAERYDPYQNKWIAFASMNMKRAYFGASVVNGDLYVVGGENSFSKLSSVERYDQHQNKWITVTAMGSKRGGVSVAVIDNKLYAVGGYSGTTRLSSVERYDSVRNVWTPISSMICRRENCGIAVYDGQLYALGGYTGTFQLSSVERYDPDQDTWKAIAPMGHKRTGVSAAVVDGQLYAIGGYDGSCFLSTVEQYDLKLNKWKSIAAMTCPRACSGVAVIDIQLLKEKDTCLFFS